MGESNTEIHFNKKCLLCSDISTAKHNVNIFEKPSLHKLISKGIDMKIKPHPELPTIVCSACICRLNFHFEFQNRAQRNIDNLRIEYYTRINNKKMVGRLTKMKRKQHNISVEKYFKTIDQSDIIEAGDLFDSFETIGQNEQSDTSTIYGNEDTDDQDESLCIDLTECSTPINNEITYLTSTPIESKKIIQNHVQNTDEDTVSDENQIQCTFNQSQNELSSNQNHSIRESFEESGLLEPMFQMSENLCDTESGGNIHTENELKSNAIHLPSKCQYCSKIYHRPHNLARHTRKHIQLIRMKNKKPVESKIFACDVNDCNEKFTTLKAIRRHYKTHNKKYICPGCNIEYENWNDMTWHIIVCKATQKKNDSIIGRKTRSRSSSAAASDNETDSEISDNDVASDITISSVGTSTIYNERLRRIENKINNSSNNVEIDSMHDDTTSDMSDISSVCSLSSTDVTISENSWTPNTGRSTTSRLRKLRKGKKEANKEGKEYFACAFSNTCTFGCTSMAKTMYHEIKSHNALLLYKCNECRQSFTTNHNLIRHSTRHSYILYCSLCKNRFDSKYSLELHTIQHHEQSYACKYCDMSFLRPTELKSHEYQQHKNDKIINRCGIVARYNSSRIQVNNTKSVSELGIKYATKELIQKQLPYNHNNNVKNHKKIVYKKIIGSIPKTIDVKLFQTNSWDLDIPKVACQRYARQNAYELEKQQNCVNNTITSQSNDITNVSQHNNGVDNNNYETNLINNNAAELTSITDEKIFSDLFSIDCLSKSDELKEKEIESFGRVFLPKNKSARRRLKRKLTELKIPVDGKYMPAYDEMFK